MNPIISSDIDKLPKIIETTTRLMSQAQTLLDNIKSNLDLILDNTLEMYNHELHRHNFHKHHGEKGHSYGFGVTTKGNAGKSYLYGCRGYRPLVELLINEMRSAIDEDNNGLRFFHDFCFSYDDDDLPLALVKIMNSFCMPGMPKHFSIGKDGTWDTKYSSEPLYWDNEYDVIHVGYDLENSSYPPKFTDRNHTVVVYTWQQYLNTLPRQMFDQYAKLLT